MGPTVVLNASLNPCLELLQKKLFFRRSCKNSQIVSSSSCTTGQAEKEGIWSSEYTKPTLTYSPKQLENKVLLVWEMSSTKQGIQLLHVTGTLQSSDHCVRQSLCLTTVAKWIFMNRYKMICLCFLKIFPSLRCP